MGWRIVRRSALRVMRRTKVFRAASLRERARPRILGAPGPAMPSLPPLSRARAVVFDAYGTLFDVHSAVARHAGAVGPDAARLSEIWRAKQLEYTWVLSLAGRQRELLDLDGARPRSARSRAARRSIGRCVRTLLAAYRCPRRVSRSARGPPPACERAASPRPSCRTAIRTCSPTPSPPRGSTAASTRSCRSRRPGVFKTSPRAYALVPDALGVEGGAVVFVSSNRWDVAGAAAFGFAPVWVNRAGAAGRVSGLDPVAVVADLRASGRRLPGLSDPARLAQRHAPPLARSRRP